MCSPQVMEKVRASISRRQVLGAIGSAGAIATFGAVTPRALAQEASPVAGPTAGTIALGAVSRVQDLSHTAGPDFPMYPGGQQLAIDVIVTIAENGFFKNQLTFDEHTGTHIDAPAHFITDGLTFDLIPVERLIAPLVIVDISSRAATDPDAQLSPDDLLAWEVQHGAIPAGAVVAMYSGWETRLSEPATYINLDASGAPHFPGFHPDAAMWLVDERDIGGIGVDTLSQDFGASTDFATHVAVLSAGKYGIENLANLSQVPPSGATIVLGGPKHVNASGGPTRALALF